MVFSLVQSLTQSKFFLRSPERDRLAGGVRARHLNKNSGIGEDLVDAVPLGADDVLVLGLLHLHAHFTELALLPRGGNGEARLIISEKNN